VKKLALMSVLIATIWIPVAIAAKTSDARIGAKRVQKHFFVFFALYVVTILYVLPRL